MKHHSSSAEPEVSRYELLVQNITDYAIYMLDPDGLVSSWNAGAQRFKGYAPDEIIGRHFSSFYTDDDRATDLPGRALSTAARDGRFEAEGWRVRKDGTRFWAHVIIDAIRACDGRLLGFAKVTRDLTERREAEEELRRSEERFRLLVQSVTDHAIYMLDENGIVVSWNPGAQRFKGYAPDEIIGQHFSRFYTPEDLAVGLPTHALATAATEGRFEAEGWRMRKDGTRFWANVVIDAVRDPAGKLFGFAKVTRDLTERRETQKALEEAREAFFQSQKLDAIGKLTGGVAHDFNNLLAVVIGSLDLAQRRLAEGGDITRFIANARSAAERGATLTQRMLAFARKQEMTLVTVDPDTALRGMDDLLQRTLGAGVVVDMQLEADLPAVSVDRGQLELALLNLAVNARDAMPNGGTILFTASTASLPAGNAVRLDPGDYVCLSVSDAGEGMDEQTLARAMEPFFTTKGVGKGTGLGLSMIHGFAEQMHGRLQLKSTPGAGTTAELWLPVAVEGLAVDDAPAPSSTTPAAGPAGALDILVVDDDALVLTNSCAMIEDLGHRVSAAGSGEEALRDMAARSFDVMITDFAMPGMNGLQLIEAARTAAPLMGVVLTSGYADLPSGRSGDLPILGKPFSEPQLADAIAAAAAGGLRVPAQTAVPA
jgi:PAS domain S-box-containing protein